MFLSFVWFYKKSLHDAMVGFIFTVKSFYMFEKTDLKEKNNDIKNLIEFKIIQCEERVLFCIKLTLNSKVF